MSLLDHKMIEPLIQQLIRDEIYKMYDEAKLMPLFLEKATHDRLDALVYTYFGTTRYQCSGCVECERAGLALCGRLIITEEKNMTFILGRDAQPGKCYKIIQDNPTHREVGKLLVMADEASEAPPLDRPADWLWANEHLMSLPANAGKHLKEIPHYRTATKQVESPESTKTIARVIELERAGAIWTRDVEAKIGDVVFAYRNVRRDIWATLVDRVQNAGRTITKILESGRGADTDKGRLDYIEGHEWLVKRSSLGYYDSKALESMMEKSRSRDQAGTNLFVQKHPDLDKTKDIIKKLSHTDAERSAWSAALRAKVEESRRLDEERERGKVLIQREWEEWE